MDQDFYVCLLIMSASTPTTPTTSTTSTTSTIEKQVFDSRDFFKKIWSCLAPRDIFKSLPLLSKIQDRYLTDMGDEDKKLLINCLKMDFEDDVAKKLTSDEMKEKTIYQRMHWYYVEWSGFKKLHGYALCEYDTDTIDETVSESECSDNDTEDTSGLFEMERSNWINYWLPIVKLFAN